MPRYINKKTNHTVETADASLGVRLRSQGYSVQVARTKRVKAAEKASEPESQETQVYVHKDAGKAPAETVVNE